MERVVYDKEELKKALQDECDVIVIKNEKLAENIKKMKATATALLYLGVISIIGTIIVTSLSWVPLFLGTSLVIVKLIGIGVIKFWSTELIIILIAGIFLEVTSLYSLYKNYDIRIGESIRIKVENSSNGNVHLVVLKKRVEV